jgi:hypothetical protein
MARVLGRRGFECVRTDVATSGVPRPGYDLITALNVIDRCARPRTLLARLTDALAPEGRLVLATPFPFRPFVYDGPVAQAPREKLDLARDSWEASVSALVETVIEPLGLEVTSFSRVPYLSGGDAARPFYVLDDAVVVCRRRSDHSDSIGGNHGATP